MDIKRMMTSIVGLPLVGVVLILGNTYVMDVLLMLIAIICMKEYFDVISKVAHPVKWVRIFKHSYNSLSFYYDSTRCSKCSNVWNTNNIINIIF